MNLEAIIRAQVRKFRWAVGGVLERDDLLQIARIAAANAAASYDPARGRCLSSHTWMYINQRLQRAVEHAYPVRFPEGARRAAYRATGQGPRAAVIPCDDDCLAFTAQTPDPDACIDRFHRACHVREAIASIRSDKQRRTVELRYLEGLTQEAIAEISGITRQAVQHQERKGLAELRANISRLPRLRPLAESTE